MQATCKHCWVQDIDVRLHKNGCAPVILSFYHVLDHEVTYACMQNGKKIGLNQHPMMTVAGNSHATIYGVYTMC